MLYYVSKLMVVGYLLKKASMNLFYELQNKIIMSRYNLEEE